MTINKTLSQLGWQAVFQQQLTIDDVEKTRIAKVAEHHRSHFLVISEHGTESVEIHASFPSMTVGDWVLLDPHGRFIRLLERKSLFARKGAGSKVTEQLIAANIDTAFIVSALDNDFNLNRIERYLAMCLDASVEPVVILTKRDLAENAGNIDIDDIRRSVEALSPLLAVEAVNSLDESTEKALSPWLKIGKTVVVMGSSGVGKSTLINTLLGDTVQVTGGIRENDSKGRHTTTSRSLHFMPSGALLLDTPGMRELQIFDNEQGVNTLFDDINQLAAQCRFSDCQHQQEPGCAIQIGIETGEIDQRRVDNYRKLREEDAKNTATLASKKAQDKAFSKMCNAVQSHHRQRKNGN